MAFEPDNELLQDFLIEAGELLNGLDQQLIELEQSPDDADRLNSVFRAFHTVKGGAGFLEVHPLVEVCHRAEDIFNLLRNHEIAMNSRIMDVMLQVIDVLNGMFDDLRAGQYPDAVSPAFLEEIEGLAHQAGEPAAADAPAEAPAPAEEPEPAVAEEDDAFDRMLADLDAAESEQAPAAAAETADDDLITDDEFENLLDELHGKGQFQAPAPAAAPEAESKAASAADSDEITDEEFEAVLDELYGKGKGPTAAAQPAAEASAEPSPAPKSETKPQQPSPAAAGKSASGSAKPKPADPPKAPAETTVRVDTERLDSIMNLVGELVLVRNRMNTLKATFENEEIASVIATLDMVTSDLQGAVMKTRMQPVKKVFGRFPRVVRDTARTLGKEVNLELEGEDTDLDKNLVEALADPLIHLVRNSVDHGIEMPDDREAKGKPRAGTVLLSAAQEGDHIRLAIQDDGSGMDAEVLRRKGVEKGVVDPESAERLTDQECFELILQPGFSTKEEISDISGRGVGMDVVKTAITRLSGTISIDSEPGEGTQINIKVPLTLAILPTLMVIVSGRKYAIPLSVVNEIFEMADKEVNVVDGQATITVRDRAVPLFRMTDWLALRGEGPGERSETDQVVMVQHGAQLMALVVDSVIGQEEVVIKPLGELLRVVEGFAGATITGDGHIALILDLPGMVRRNAGGRGRNRLRSVA
ncbi:MULTISPECIES: chemotaxis protein CheA [unclassified Guyparkeria]|uniref:chemotaxis protein CheA n=1 Tax=unclassified Guyparkeria TaxID=2626246 RepID=UPI0007337380|nr:MULTISPECIES: chemotaxis protein CheA [unclassified Guyparkeria]KTG16448.1 chemotaxis protein CheA [Guyparkeria sp. XI15]OAE85388.1 chemotaxis protein CheA [Guyparkeria sp. WRN-7]